MMDGYSQRNHTHHHGIMGLWWNWAIGVGLLTGIIFLGMFISKVWLPLIALGLDILLVAMVRRSRVAGQPTCYLIPFIVTRAMFWSAAIMVAINFMNTHWFPHDLFDSQFSNPDIPYITVLIVAPITMLVSVYALMRGRNLNFCVECRMRNGSAVERGLLGNILSQEAGFQLRLLFWMSAVVSVISWAYYAFFYINTDMNRPDNFFFRWVPVLMYAFSLGYFGIRYLSIWQYYWQNMDSSAWGHGRFTMLRYLVMYEDSILLSELDEDRGEVNPEDVRLDTPCKIRVPYRERVTEADSVAYFRNLTDVEDARVRFLYLNANFNADSNIYHYACFLSDPEIPDGSRLAGKWYTLPQIQRLSGSGRVAPALTAEINRIYTISMAWKTYDRRGRRLYDIKNYKPTFRLRDLQKWDVDLNDSNWLLVANQNEDCRFYHLKRLWRKYVHGVGE